MGFELLVLLLIVAAALLMWRRSTTPAAGRQRLAVNGSWRNYSVYRPRGAIPSAPVLLCFHGGLGRVDRFQRHSGIVEAAERNGFVVTFPEAPGGWIDARPERGESRRDLEFVDALIDRLRLSEGSTKFYAVGTSNGGMFVHRLAMERQERFTGVATINASIPAAAVRGLPPSGPAVPIMLVFGRDDHIMPYGGGRIPQGRRPGMGVGGLVISAEETLRYWLRRNRADGEPTTQRMADGRVEVRDYAPIPTGAPVRFVRIAGWGHKWPRWRGEANGAGGFDISDVIFEFFTRQPVVRPVVEAEPARIRLGGE